jgi:phospholipase/carboxylesterase
MRSELDPAGVLWSEPEPQRRGRPLLVLLHGHGMDERVGFELRQHLPPALVVASLRGPLRARGGYGWFAMDHTFDLAQVANATQAVLTWLDEQSGHSSVGVLGFSQGSGIAVDCLRARPSTFSCAVILAGFVNPLPSPGDAVLAQHRPPVFSGRGAADTVIPQPLVAATDHWLSTHTTLTSKTYPGLGHTVHPEEISDVAEFLATHLP